MADINNIKYDAATEIPSSEFEFAHKDESIHDTKFETRPVGWLEDSVKRFAKNKASVVAFIILVIIGLFSIIVPIASPMTYVSKSDFPTGFKDKVFETVLPRISSDAPKFGFWDGTRKETLGDGTYRSYLYNDSNYDPIVGEVTITKTRVTPTLTIFNYSGLVDTYAVGTKVVNLSAEEYSALVKYEKEKGISMATDPVKNAKKSILKPWVDYETYLAGEYTQWVIDYYNQNGSTEDISTYLVNRLDAITKQYKNNASIYYKIKPDTKSGLNDTKFLPDDNFDGEKVTVYADDLYLRDASGELQYFELEESGRYNVRVDYYDYFTYKYGFEPNYIFGANQYGEDIFLRIALGARFSLLLGICISLINFIIGLIYGAIAGYYGGKVDLVMERITDIIANVPTIIIMTIAQIQLVNNLELKAALGSAGTLVLAILIAFVYNGWIGTAGTTRMQFYRFKGQEYVLASRTLGAKDSRLIFKHILPNAVGTLVTSSVLMVPGVIFSETSLAYLGIIDFTSSGISSIGAMLNEGKAAGIDKVPHVIIFPALIISLLMICFNLFGNGLRDAFNTTLRGSED